MEEEKVKMKLDIAGESFLISVPYSQQEETRQTEKELNSLFDAWRRRFPDKGDRELLAMIAFRYAERHTSLMRERGEALKEADALNARLDKILVS